MSQNSICNVRDTRQLSPTRCVIEAIRAGPKGRIAIAFIEWSGILQQKIVIDWTVISNDETARQFSDHILEAPRAFARNSTSISAGIDFATTQFDRAPYEARCVLSTYRGMATITAAVTSTARDEAIAKDVTINGLVILTKTPTPWNSRHTNPLGGLANYYRNDVIGGPGAFVMVAKNFNSFGEVLVKKLITETAGKLHGVAPGGTKAIPIPLPPWALDIRLVIDDDRVDVAAECAGEMRAGCVREKRLPNDDAEAFRHRDQASERSGGPFLRPSKMPTPAQ
jgi:hypothetical protein